MMLTKASWMALQTTYDNMTVWNASHNKVNRHVAEVVLLTIEAAVVYVVVAAVVVDAVTSFLVIRLTAFSALLRGPSVLFLWLVVYPGAQGRLVALVNGQRTMRVL